jgi:AraC family ethanolamine operon transcriptional activator
MGTAVNGITSKNGPPGFWINFDDPDEFAAAQRRANVRIDDTGSGPFGFRLGTFDTGICGVQLTWNREEMVARASAHEDRFYLLIGPAEPKPWTCLGAPMGPWSVGLYPGGSSNVIRMPSDFELVMLSIDPDPIRRAADDLGYDDLRLTTSAPTILQAAPLPVASIRRFLRHFPRMLHDSPADGSQLKFWMDRTLPRLTARLLALEQSSSTNHRISSRQRILNRVEGFLEANADASIYIADLCVAAGVSERTLANVFHQCFGLSPIRYLRVRRLHQVRRALRTSDPGTTSVSEIASLFGFWHFGRFAADFKALFEQTPSELLRHRPA